MIHKFKSIDCPDANGRIPNFGEQKWTLSFPLENGDDYIELEIGRQGREALLMMLKQETIDDNQLCASCKHALSKHQDGTCTECNCMGFVNDDQE